MFSQNMEQIRRSGVPVKHRRSAGELMRGRNHKKHKGHKRASLLLCPLCFLWFLPLSLTCMVLAAVQTNAQAGPATSLREFVTTYCTTCHNDRLKTGNLVLDKADAERVSNSAETWEKVVV